jgi:hypothetical protein
VLLEAVKVSLEGACRGHASIMEIESTFRGHDRDH